MWNLFQIKNTSVKLSRSKILVHPSADTKSKGINNILYRACSLWNSIDNDTMCAKNIDSFKNGISKWPGNKCSCKICRQ